MSRHSLSGKKIKLLCTLKNKQGKLLGQPGSILVVGRDLSIKLAKQLLAGQSAALSKKRPLKPVADVHKWPDPIMWGPFECKGKANAKTISVHICVYLNGNNRSWLKLQAPPATFSKLDHWFRNVSERRLGVLVMKVLHAGSGNRSVSHEWPLLPGINFEEPEVGEVRSGRSIPIKIVIKQDGEEHSIKFLAQRVVFQNLASFHHGDEASDIRYGDLLRHALGNARTHILGAHNLNGIKKGKRLQRIAWKTAAWLGPALLAQLRATVETNSGLPRTIISCMTKEQPLLKQNLRNMAAFLVFKNWQNWRTRLHERIEIPEWPTPLSPIFRRRKDEGVGNYGSAEFWDEIFNRQLKLKRFAWSRLRNSRLKRFRNRFRELTEPDIEKRKAFYAESNPGFDWKKCKEDNPHQFRSLIAKFLDDHMSLNQFAINKKEPMRFAGSVKSSKTKRRELKKDGTIDTLLFTIPTQGPTFILPKSLEATVEDILLNRDVFILHR